MPFSKASLPAICIIFIAGLLPRHVVGQERESNERDRWTSIQQRAEQILRKSLIKARDSDGESLVRKLRDWPIELAEPELLRVLRRSSLEARLEAAERLTDETGARHRDAIVEAISELLPNDDISRARLAVLRLRLGHVNALEEVREWGRLDGKRQRTVPTWLCPMHPLIKRPAEEKCGICEMTLVEVPWRFEYAQRQAQLVALTALADRKDDNVPALARTILTDSAEPHWRLNAACQWARVSPNGGLPHVRVFLESPRLHMAGPPVVDVMDDDLARELKAELKAILDDASQPPHVHLQAMDRLLAAGERDYLEKIRHFVESADTAEKYYLELGHEAVNVLKKHGNAEDIERLARLLGEAWAEDAAAAILHIIARYQ